MSNHRPLNVQQDSSVTFQGDTILHVAVRKGDLIRVREICYQNRSLIQVQNKFGETALNIACKYGHQPIVNQLLTEYKKPDVTQQIYGEGETDTSLLYAAVQGGSFEIVRAILNDPAWHTDLMTREDKCGRCAIHVAAMRGQLDIITELMTRMPTCVEIYSSDHKSVLHFVVQYNRTEIVKKLTEEDTVRQLVSGDRDLYQNTALHLAAQYGVDSQIVDRLLSRGIGHVNAMNDEGLTALDIASAAAEHNHNCDAIVENLRRAGALCSRRIIEPNATPQNQSRAVEESPQHNGSGADNTENTHVVVASLIATITFAATIQIPGGLRIIQTVYTMELPSSHSVLFSKCSYSRTLRLSSIPSW